MTTWIPLESNPEVMTKYLHKLGVPNKWSIVDIYALEPDMLAWVPRPVLALILLFPCSAKYEEHRAAEDAKLTASPQEISKNLFYMKQTVHNACGTIALVHSVANNTDQIQLGDGVLKQFLEDSESADAQSRGNGLETCEGIMNAHKELAMEGQTNAPGLDEPVNHHFVALVHKDGHLYELDGRKSFPINHGTTTPNTFLEDAAKVCQGFMARDPDELRFTVVALTPTPQ
ncbi:ubiquitin carboxyl-terminal hydrolase-like [Ctenocephalides felis]|uniref:ubiquitin carboxyl-terminal hydrolase-like n=1 Tax=Ctenocephalides felis TaxID=7515 RepID=UPI000E6E56A0|nr:ubiquitin carboxyl-terminal hydrolase-like [Ctenocephalides felis]